MRIIAPLLQKHQVSHQKYGVFFLKAIFLDKSTIRVQLHEDALALGIAISEKASYTEDVSDLQTQFNISYREYTIKITFGWHICVIITF